MQREDGKQHKSADRQNNQKRSTPKKYCGPANNPGTDRGGKPAKAEPQHESISHNAISPPACERDDSGDDSKDEANSRVRDSRGLSDREIRLNSRHLYFGLFAALVAWSF